MKKCRRSNLLISLLLISSFSGRQETCHGFSPIVPGVETPRRSVSRLGVFENKKKKQTTSSSTEADSDTKQRKYDFPWNKRNNNNDEGQTLLMDPLADLDTEVEMATSLAGAEMSLEKLLVPTLGVLLVAAGVGVAYNTGGADSLMSLSEITETAKAFSADPQGTIQSTLDGMGPLGIIYFGALYVAAELLALPATPLTLSAGYLFGLTQGILVVLAAGTLSAMAGFFIGKTFLRSWVETVLEENPKFKKLDTAIGEEGFKLLVLVRLSPIFPFSLINYTYGASSISFPTFVAGTMLGFTPSTIGYVYTGLVGKEVLLGEGSQPWYVYAGGLTVLFGFLKLVTDIATEIVEAIDDEEA